MLALVLRDWLFVNNSQTRWCRAWYYVLSTSHAIRELCFQSELLPLFESLNMEVPLALRKHHGDMLQVGRAVYLMELLHYPSFPSFNASNQAEFHVYASHVKDRELC